MESNETRDLVCGNSRFAFDLYKRLSTTNTNMVFSPYSISVVWAMAYAGARGMTARQIADTLHFELDQGIIHQAFSALAASYRFEGTHKTILEAANAVWGLCGTSLANDYISIIRNCYNIDLAALGNATSPSQLIGTINQWAAEKTHGKISEIVSYLSPVAGIILASAVYFRGEWVKKFKKRDTKEDSFYIGSEKSIKVEMMTQRNRFDYAEFEDLQLIELPYDGKDLCMLIILPRQIDGIYRLEETMTYENVIQCIDQLQERNVMVTIPRFKIESTLDLGPTLMSMGIIDAFSTEKAEFSGMSKNAKGLYIRHVLHKAVIDLSEKGTEAAAVTAIGLITGLQETSIHEPVIFRADHPFMYIIFDWIARSIIFLGRVMMPDGNRN